MSIELKGVRKAYGAAKGVEEVTASIATGELVALLGPSGAGKTTLLRMIAGLEIPDAGSIIVDGRDVTKLGVRERGMGFVFQHYALFKHMTVAENVAFGLRVKPRAQRPSEDDIRRKVGDLLNLIQLDSLAERYPAELSGGQRQRVALARALAIEPKVLLLDEPFGAVDAKVRQDLRRWLRRLHDELHVTSVFVTHDQEEALEVADRVVVMSEGRVEQIGTPREVYDKPATPFVCHFIGRVNLFRGRAHAGMVRIGDMQLLAPEHASAEDRPVMVYARPHDIEVSNRPGHDCLGGGILRHVHAAGPVVRLEIERASDECPLVVECSAQAHEELEIRLGQPVYFRLRERRVFFSN